MNEQACKLLLPFIVPTEDRKRRFGEDMEKAAVLCLAEMGRKKRVEKLVFTAQFYYPAWLVPWGKRSVLFDGMGIATHAVTYDVLPEVQEFIGDVEESGKSREAYSAFLSDSLNYFKKFAGQENKTVNGLIANPDFIRDVVPYLKEVKRVRKELSDRVFLAPALDESTVSSIVQDLTGVRDLVKRDIENLRKSMSLLNRATRNHVKATHEEIKETKKKFDQKVADLKPSIAEEIQRIKRRYSEKITKLAEEAKPQLRRLHRERAKLEKTIQENRAKMERCEAEIKSCKLRKDKEGERRWKKEIKRCEKEISDVEKEIKTLDEKIEGEEANKKREIAKLRSKCDKKVGKVNKKLRGLEASRDGEIQMDQKEIESLEDFTSTIINQIDNLVTLKKKALDELNGLGVSKKQIRRALVHIPAYLVCYRKNLEERYEMYPPSFAGSLGILTKFKGVFGVAKAKSLLKPRSEPLTSFLNQLLVLMDQDPVFRKNVLDAGVKANILGTAESRSEVKRGLRKLREEKWISESEFETLSSLL